MTIRPFSINSGLIKPGTTCTPSIIILIPSFRDLSIIASIPTLTTSTWLIKPSITVSTRIAGVLMLSYASKLERWITGFKSFDIILRITSRIISVLIIFFKPKRLANSKAIEEVPTPEAPPIKIIKGLFDFLTTLHLRYFCDATSSKFSK